MPHKILQVSRQEGRRHAATAAAAVAWSGTGASSRRQGSRPCKDCIFSRWRGLLPAVERCYRQDRSCILVACSELCRRKQSRIGEYDTVPAWRSLKPGELSSFQSEGLNVNNQEMWYLVDVSVPSTGAKSIYPIIAILDSGYRIKTMSADVAARWQAMVPDVRVLTPMVAEQLVKPAPCERF